MGSWLDETAGLVVLPDGRRLRGRALRHGAGVVVEPPELCVYLTARRPRTPAWDPRWVRWFDFGLPLSTRGALDALREAHRRSATERVEIACGGGIGRTGTAIAILARLAGVPADEAVAWTRAHYRSDAIETPWQRAYVRRVGLDR